MAGTPVGTIYAELDLDTSRYTRSQQQLLRDATQTTLNIEQNFKNLGVRSSAEFDLMRQKIQNSYAMIASSSKATADDIVRAEQAKNDKLRQLDEQQFGRQAGMMEKLKSNWMGLAATVGAAMMAVNKAWNLMGTAADYQERINSVDALGKKYGQTGTQIVQSMQDASRGLLSMADAADMAASALNLSLSPEQMVAFTRVSEQLTDVIGGSIPEAFSRMTVAAASGRTQTLAQMGILVDLEAAYEKYASQTGRTADELSAMEKQTVRLNVILAEAQKKTEELGPATDTFRDKMDRLGVTLKDIELILGQGLIRAVSGAMGVFNTLASGALTAYAGMLKLEEVYFKLQSIFSFGGASKLYAAASQAAAQDYAAAMGAAEELAGKASEQFAVMTASTDELASAQGRAHKAIAQNIEGTEDLTKAQKKAADEAVKAEEKKADTLRAILKSEADFREQMDKDREAAIKANADKEVKTAQETRDTLREILLSQTKFEEEQDKEREKALKEMAEKVKKAAEEEKKLAAEKLRAARDLYKDLKGHEADYYAVSVRLLRQQRDEFIRLTDDKEAAEARFTRQLKDLDIEKLKSSQSYFDGLQGYFLEAEDQAKTSGERMYDFMKTFGAESEKAVSDTLFQAIKTGSVDAEQIFSTFTDTMLRKLTDTIAQMVIEAAANEIRLGFDARWTGAAMGVLGTIGQIVGWGADWFSGGDTGGVNWEQIGGEGVWAMAKGGHFPSGQPMWVGEEGPELVFPQGSGYVMPHGQSVAYAARNGGHIPGYAEGGEYGEDNTWVWDILKNVGHPAGPSIYYSRQPTPGEILAASKIKAGEANQYGWTPEYIREYGQPMWFNVWSQHIAPMDAQMSPNLVGVPHPERQGTIAGGMFSDPIFNIANAVMSYIAPIWGVIMGAVKAGHGLYYKDWGMAAGGAIGAAGSAYSIYSGAASGAQAGTDVAGVGMGGAGEAATGFSTLYGLTGVAADVAARYLARYVAQNIFGSGSGSDSLLDVNFSGMSGGPDFRPFLSSLSGASSVSWPVMSAKNGLDYVPYDGMPIIAHKGEAVITREQNERRGGVVVNVHYHGTVIEERKAARQIAEMIYPETQKLAGWGH